MNRSGKSARRPLDFYPTPPPVTHALIDTTDGVVDYTRVLDPAAGDGALLREIPAEVRCAIEIDGAHRAALEEVCTWPSVPLIADATVAQWPADVTVVANPPFGLLDTFWEKAVHHRDRHRRAACLFMPVAWWSAEKRRAYVEPDLIVQLGWRPVFHLGKAGPAHKGAQDFIWSCLLPEPAETITWIRALKRVA